MNITHIIFDNDGLLVDTEGLYDVIIQKILDKYEKKFTKELKNKTMGSKNREAAKILIKALNIQMTEDEYDTKLKALIPQYLSSTTLLPGVEDLINHLHKNDIPMAVATGSDEESFKLKTKNHKELFSKLSHTVCGSDNEVKQGKPAPDIYQVALRRFPSPPEPHKVLVFEDSLNGVKAGLAAGMNVVWVVDMRYCPFSKQEVEDFKSEKVTIIYNMKEVVPEKFNLPPFSVA